jgi:dihydrodipicolinate reductase
MKVVLIGYGKMGKELEKILLERGHEIVGVVERGGDFEVIKEGEAVLEFAHSSATFEALERAKKYRKKYILGTTGYSEGDMEKIIEFGNFIPIVYSPNFSVGVYLMGEFLKLLKEFVGDWDIEIVEIHHRWKKDSPSGTALKLAGIFGREINSSRKGERKEGEIGVFGVRGGDVFGEHTVFLFSEGERLEITHRLSSRRALAKGVLLSLDFLKDKDRGFYTFEDVLRENFTYRR